MAQAASVEPEVIDPLINGFTKLKPLTDTHSYIDDKRYRAYLDEKSTQAVFNFKSALVINRNSLGGDAEQQLHSNTLLLSNNADYPVITEYDIPTIVPQQCVQGHQHLSNIFKTTAVEPSFKPQERKFTQVHAIRQSKPHAGPGTRNLKEIYADGAYVRVAGIISQLSYEFMDLILPRWLPVLLDISYYIVTHCDDPSLDLVQVNIIKTKYTSFIISILTLISQAQKTNFSIKEKMQAVINKSKQLEKKLDISLKTIVQRRAKDELNGQAGSLYEAALYLHDVMNLSNTYQYSREFFSLFNQIFIATATENVSYAKPAQSMPYCSGSMSQSDAYFSVRTKNPDIHILKKYLLPQGSNSDIIFCNGGFSLSPEMLNLTVIDLSASIRPTISNIINCRLEMNIIIMPMLSSETLNLELFKNLKKIDRSSFVKSGINLYDEEDAQSVVNVEQKLNGFQYQLSYTKNDNTHTVKARYPQAPQIIIGGNFNYDFDINVEIAPLSSKNFEVRIISVREFQGIVPQNSENGFFLQDIRRRTIFNIVNHTQWPYNKPDGLILTYTNGSQVYLKKYETIDMMYDLEADESVVMCKEFREDAVVYQKNQWASSILQQHIKYKPATYLERLKKSTLLVDQKKNKSKYTFNINNLGITPEQSIPLMDPGPAYPFIQNCYNLCISYTAVKISSVKFEKEVDIAKVDQLNDVMSVKKKILTIGNTSDVSLLNNKKIDSFFN